MDHATNIWTSRVRSAMQLKFTERPSGSLNYFIIRIDDDEHLRLDISLAHGGWSTEKIVPKPRTEVAVMISNPTFLINQPAILQQPSSPQLLF